MRVTVDPLSSDKTGSRSTLTRLTEESFGETFTTDH